MKTITMICWKRPDYFKRAFDSIMANPDAYLFDKIYIFVEPNHPEEMVFLFSHIKEHFGDWVEIHYNEKQLGVDLNGHTAINHAFQQGSNLNVHVEEDVILSKDALNLILDSGLTHQHDQCGCLCLHNHNGHSPGLNDSVFQYIHEFNPYGWACTKEQWVFLSAEWFTNRWSPDGREKYGWDWSVNYHFAKTQEKYSLMPMVSRATTIGELGGVNMSPQQWQAHFSKQQIK